ncbi:hypothetical protein CFC21_070382 [Triticum aestivum]|uniref:RING-type domain-containing protein n=3 Tax=Triticum TaxID=4564 RepID=A0A9R0X1P9_TRITD|nr:hypothetical protein CFC21_070382 [Triticum aestivum]VAI28309.1 unnamed protein product [Triticum turgidum subsp. durum]
MEGEYYDSLVARFGEQGSLIEGFGREAEGPDAYRTQLRQRMSQDFLLRNLEERRRAADDVCSDPASKKAMLGLQVLTVGETREQDCAVCLEEFIDGGKKLRMMPCYHSFHQRCIFDWLRLNRICPVCRFALAPQSDDDNNNKELGLPEKVE